MHHCEIDWLRRKAGQIVRNDDQAFLNCKVLGREVVLVKSGDVIGATGTLLETAPQTVLFCNVHMLMLSQQDTVLAEAMDHADLVFADGVPVSWLQSRLFGQEAGTVRGYEVMLQLCRKAAGEGKRVGLFGSSPATLNALEQRLKVRFPGLEMAYTEAPPYVDGELITDPDTLEKINSAGLAYLFISLGCPKQEKWIYHNAEKLNCSLLGVGAAFEWLAGIEPMPPRWMKKAGLGWLHRLLRNPGRMWHRYLVYNPAFAVAAAGALWAKRRRGRAGTEGHGT